MVSLVGAGPGDPGLLTIRGKELLEKADVIIYDALVAPAILKHARSDAEFIYVGKIAGNHALPQNEINALLVEKAIGGAKVVRLKGGDPYIFGRGGEEAEYLRAHDVPFEEVPGITSAIAAPAYAGIPLTHRNFVSSLTIITGHEKPEKDRSAHNWRAYAESGSTLVFVMGVKNLPNIAESLIKAGMPPDIMAAIIYRGTTPKQRVLKSSLAQLPLEARKHNFQNPSIVVVGKVVELGGVLDWYSSRPLLGRTIVVTRAREQASDIAQGLQELGAEVIEFPGISINPLLDYELCDAAIAKLPEYDWIIFTSVNGVKYFWKRLACAGKDSRFLGRIKVAAIGPATAQALQRKGIQPDLMPATYVAEGIMDAMTGLGADSLKGQNILLPRAARARNVLPDELRLAGANVDVVPLYQALAPAMDGSRLVDALQNGEIDCISFGSSSTVENFLSAIPASMLQENPNVHLAAIGPITAGTLAKNGLSAQIQPAHYTIPALIEAIVAFFTHEGLKQ